MKKKTKAKRKVRRRIPPTYCEAPPPPPPDPKTIATREATVIMGSLLAALSHAEIGLGELFSKPSVLITMHTTVDANAVALMLVRMSECYRRMM